jgi:hypothetical protein
MSSELSSSKVKVISLTEALPDEDVERLGGTFVDSTMYSQVITGDTDVFTPEGNVLLKFRKNVIPIEMCEKTFPIWELAATPTDNRGMAAGAPEIGSDGKIKDLRKEHCKVLPFEKGATRVRFLKQDGTVAKKTVAKTVNSGIVGFVDGNSRFPYCRLTAFNAQHMDQFNSCMPLIVLVDRLFSELMPERHKAQMEYHNRTSDDFKIPSTSFTTLTVNKNFRTAIHSDKGDLECGFGVMTAMWKGKHRGGFLCFPKYRVAVDMQTGDLLCANVHCLHGNDEIKGITGTLTRISLVFYYREQVAQCGTAEEERLKAIAKTESTYAKQDTKQEELGL